MERDTELLSTFQPNQCQNASQKFYAGSALFRGMARWGHVPIHYVTYQGEGGDYERTRPNSTQRPP